MTFEGIAGFVFSHIAIDDVSITSGNCQEQTATPALPSSSAPAPSLLSSAYPMLSTDKPSFTSTLSTVSLPTIKSSLSSSQSTFHSSTTKPSFSSELPTSKASFSSSLSTFKPSLSSSVFSGIVNLNFDTSLYTKCFIFPLLKIVCIFA